MTATDAIIDPELPIIDPHHHFWFVPATALQALRERTDEAAPTLLRIYAARPRYLFDELLADMEAGHNVRATVYVEGHAMYRAAGPAAMRPVGEIEFANGMAAIAASGLFTYCRIAAAIVGCVDLRLGNRVGELLDAQERAGGDRYRGIRAPGVAHDPAMPARGGVPHLLAQPEFRQGLHQAEARGLSLDVYLYDPQLPELADLADAFPALRIILNHAGTPLGIGPYAGRHDERFSTWRDNARALAQRPNVVVKLGGLGNPICGLQMPADERQSPSEHLAALWRPYIETCIEAFGAERCMFESNFPVDAATAEYRTIWNAFKRIAAGASSREKEYLFSRTAADVYRIDID